MNTLLHHESNRTRNHRNGIMLVECLVYLALFFLLLVIAFPVFDRCWNNSRGYQRTMDDLTAALRIGERWRGDVRAAAGPVRFENSAGEQIVRIPGKSGEVSYRFSEDKVWRRSGADSQWVQFLAGVKSSRMETDARKRVKAVRWELELNPRRKSVSMNPLFTFLAVPQTSSTP